MIKRTLLLLTLTAVALVGLPGLASAQTGSAACSGKEIYFFFQYNFDNGQTQYDEGCWPKNEVTKFDVSPALIATSLHISCSDKISSAGVPEKSDLGNPARRIVSYFIRKPDGKTCGSGTPIPAGGIAGVLLVATGLGALGLTRRRRREVLPPAA